MCKIIPRVPDLIPNIVIGYALHLSKSYRLCNNDTLRFRYLLYSLWSLSVYLGRINRPTGDSVSVIVG